MRVLAFDLSTSSGVGVLDHDPATNVTTLVHYATVANKKTAAEYAKYPFGPMLAARDMVSKLLPYVQQYKPDTIVIEEINISRFSGRYSQKLLDFIHCLLMVELHAMDWTDTNVKYISTSVWRKAVGIELTKEQRKQNQRLGKASREAKRRGEKLDKAALGIAGKISKKHLAVAWANERFGLALRPKDNDASEALAQGVAYLMGSKLCDGK